jgi:kinetochore protein Mis13/DSN1
MGRASLGLRGKRVSEAYNGMCPIPHPDIVSNVFYTLIDADVSEPLRMRQLLLWCALKTAETFPFQPNGFADEKVMAIQDKIIQALTTKTLNTSWYHRPVFFFNKEIVETRPKQPHPNNIENKKKIEIFENQLKRYSFTD